MAVPMSQQSDFLQAAYAARRACWAAARLPSVREHPMQPSDTPDFRVLLQAAVAKGGGNTAWAAKHGFSRSLVSMVMGGTREPTESIINALGFIRRVTYHRLERT